MSSKAIFFTLSAWLGIFTMVMFGATVMVGFMVDSDLQEWIGKSYFGNYKEGSKFVSLKSSKKVTITWLGVNKMDLRGLGTKGAQGWNLGRSLLDKEIRNKLSKDIALSDSPADIVNVVSINKSYLELSDRWYNDKGMPSLIGFFALLTASVIFFIILFATWPLNEFGAWMLLLLNLFLICLPCLYVCKVYLPLELFKKTYYPVIFDRHKSMVYVSLPKNQYIEASWSDIFFFIDANETPATGKTYEIKGHILSEDGETVINTFGISSSPVNDLNLVYQHWEFVRRYMNKRYDVKSLIASVEFCIPIEGKKEKLGTSIIVGMTPLARIVVLQFLFSPLLFLITMSRRIVIKTSKNVVWPDEIKSKIPDVSSDPDRKDITTNPKFNVYEKYTAYVNFCIGGAVAIYFCNYVVKIMSL